MLRLDKDNEVQIATKVINPKGEEEIPKVHHTYDGRTYTYSLFNSKDTKIGHIEFEAENRVQTHRAIKVIDIKNITDGQYKNVGTVLHEIAIKQSRENGHETATLEVKGDTLLFHYRLGYRFNDGEDWEDYHHSRRLSFPWEKFDEKFLTSKITGKSAYSIWKYKIPNHDLNSETYDDVFAFYSMLYQKSNRKKAINEHRERLERASEDRKTQTGKIRIKEEALNALKQNELMNVTNLRSAILEQFKKLEGTTLTFPINVLKQKQDIFSRLEKRKDNQHNKKVLYHFQKKEKLLRKIRIGFFAFLVPIFALTLILSPIIYLLIKQIKNDISVNKKAAASPLKILKEKRPKDKELEIRRNRKQFKEQAAEQNLYSLILKPKKRDPENTIKYVTAEQLKLDNQFLNENYKIPEDEEKIDEKKSYEERKKEKEIKKQEKFKKLYSLFSESQKIKHTQDLAIEGELTRYKK